MNEYENSQIKLVKNYKWLDISKLDGFTDEVRKILECNKLLSNERIDKIVSEVDKRIDYIKRVANDFDDGIEI